jgi:alkylation response protein AidB-like acyl-CoA dehydrogenase
MDVLKNIESITDAINARADEIEKERKLPADIADHLRESGVFRLLIPKALGGLECDPMTAFCAMERLAMADSSTGWCARMGSTTAVVSAYLPEEVAKPIYGDPKVITGGVFAPKGTAVLEGDHYRVNGHWNWASGSTHSDWLMGGSVILEDRKPKLLPNGAPDARMMIFPATEVELPDTWFVTGQSGTGSGDMVAKDLLVPEARSVSLMVDKPQYGSPLYLFPVFGFLALGVASVALGNARGAAEDFKELAGAKTPQGSTRVLADKPQVQIAVAEAEARLQSARAFVFDAVEDAWEKAKSSGEMTIETRGRLRLAATHAARTAADVTRVFYDLGGGSSVFLSSPLQRRFRDAHVATAHIMVAPATYELTGRVLLERESDVTFL